MPTILVIEDDALFRDMIIMALDEAGFETFAASHGRAGLALARERRPDLIISDVQMQGLDGYGVLAALREDPETALIPIILMTGMPDEEGMREGMSRGADDYLPKPFNISDLLATVNARLQKQQVMRQQTEEKMEALRANISMALPHELRTPLSSIISGAEMIVNYGEGMDFEEIVELSSLIHRAGQRLSRLVENFMIYAQLEMFERDAETVALLKQEYTYNPQAVLRRVAENKAEEQGRTDDLTLRLANLPIAISERYLEKIADELLDNAFKYSEAGSAICVEASVGQGEYQVCVRDEGYGMNARQLEDIGAYMQFERKLHEQQGTGLGLQIVRQLTQLHDGHFHITSALKAGTTVEVVLKGWEWAQAGTDSRTTPSFGEGV